MAHMSHMTHMSHMAHMSHMTHMSLALRCPRLRFTSLLRWLHLGVTVLIYEVYVGVIWLKMSHMTPMSFALCCHRLVCHITLLSTEWGGVSRHICELYVGWDMTHTTLMSFGALCCYWLGSHITLLLTECGCHVTHLWSICRFEMTHTCHVSIICRCDMTHLVNPRTRVRGGTTSSWQQLTCVMCRSHVQGGEDSWDPLSL